MPQTSGPLATGSVSERQFTDVLWRNLFGDEPGVIGDYDGSAYKLTLSPNSDVVSVGSTTQDSLAIVAGFLHKIPKGETEPITIGPAVGTEQTTLITLRYDSTHTGAPGPVRLAKISNNSVSSPVYDTGPPDAEELPLWLVTRTPGQVLSQAKVTRIFPRRAPVLEIAAGMHLPYSAPVGTLLHRATETYVRQLNAQGVATWVPRYETPDTGWVSSGITASAGWTVIATGTGAPSAYRVRDGWATINIRVLRNEGQPAITGGPTGNIGGDPVFAQIPIAARPDRTVYTTFNLGGIGSGGARVNPDGTISVTDIYPNREIGPGQWVDVFQMWPMP